MPFAILSFLAGVLTTLAPCTLPVLPVILAGSTEDRNKFRPLLIVLSLGISVFLFTLLLKATTLFFFIPQGFWNLLSGSILIGYSLTLLFPQIYERIAFKLKLYKSEGLLSFGKRKGLLGPVLIGASLGPIFASCSPTYAIIVAITLPQDLAGGIFSLALYVLGMVIPLLLIAYGSQSMLTRLKSFANPKSLVKRILAILLLITGLIVLLGFDKTITVFLLEHDINCGGLLENFLLD